MISARRPEARRWTGRLGAVVTLLLVALASPAPAGAAADDALAVRLTGVSPGYLTPDQHLTVSGTVTNLSSSAVDLISLALRIQTTAPSTRSALDLWLDPGVSQAATRLALQQPDQRLEPGGTTAFEFTVDPTDLPLSRTAAAWGPRGIAVDAVSAGGDRGRAVTHVVWYPGSTAAATDVSLLVPLVPSSQELTDAALASGTLAEQSGERMLAIAAATAADRAVAWALDPALVLPTGERAGTDPGEEPSSDGAEPAAAANPDEADLSTGAATPAPSGSAETDTAPETEPEPPALTELLAPLASGRELVGLPYAALDEAATTHTGHGELHATATEIGNAALADAGLSALEGVAWPTAQVPDRATLRALADKGAGTFVVSDAAVPLIRELTYTPTGRATASTGNGTVSLLVAESALSAALGGAAPAGDGQRADDLAARQYLLALTAMVSRERPSDARHLLAVAPKGFEGDTTALHDRIAALAEAPWVRLAPLSELAARPDPGYERAGLPEEAPEAGEASAALLAQVGAALDSLAQFSAIVAEPDRVAVAERHRLLQVAAGSWRGDEAGREAFANLTRAAAADFQTRIGVIATGTVNLISEVGDLPVSLRNELDQDVAARLRLTPDGPSILLGDAVDVIVPARSEHTVPVRVSAVGSADVEITAVLTDQQGQVDGESATRSVRVRADWENVGTAVLAGLLGLALVVGLVRSIRRANRRRERAAEAGVEQ